MKNNSTNGGRPQKPRANSARQTEGTSNENRKDFNANSERPNKGKPRTSSFDSKPRFKKSDEGNSGRPKPVTNPRSKKYNPDLEASKGPKSSYAGRSNKFAGKSDRSDSKPYAKKPFTKGEGDAKSYPKKSFTRDDSDSKPYAKKPFTKGEGESKPYPKKAFVKGDSDSKPFAKNPFSKEFDDNSEKPTRVRPGDKTYRVRKPTKATQIGDDDVSLSKIVSGKGLHARGKKKEYTSKLQKTVEAPEYDMKKMSQLSKAKSKGKVDTDIRLNRYISNAGICSRRDADLLIQMGEIKVNGKIVTEMGYQVKAGDEVRYGTKILNREKKVYVLLNKPKDFITTTDDPQERRTVMQLVANAGKERIYPVGRLDRNTTGLLLMTNDGELSMKLAHPTHKIKKIYMVELDKPITTADFDKVRNGLHLEDGIAEVDDLALIGNTRTFLGIEIHIGRNRIVRRIFESLGYEVKALDRVMYAGLTKKDLPRGTWRYLTEKEVISLKFF